MAEERKRQVIMTTGDVARVLHWDTQRARRWLQRSGAGVKRNGRIVTTPGLLANHFPELFNELMFDIGDGREL